MRVAVTGVTGFVGRSLATRLLADGHDVRAIVRRSIGIPVAQPDLIEVGTIDDTTDWRHALPGVDVVVHLAARTHVLHERGGGDLTAYRSVNVDGTRRLAEAAAVCGVRRIIFASSIKVNGERTSESPFRAGDAPAPEDAYGISKWEGEQALADVARSTGLEAVVIRPPLVYGPGASGNFARLIRAVRRGALLPLAAVDNRRSLIALENLVDLIARCVTHPAAPGRTFLVSDGEDLSTPDLIRRIAQAMGTRPRLIPVPPGVLRMVGRLTRRTADVDRLLGSLQVEIEHTRQALDWAPPLTVDEGLRRAVTDA